MRREFFRMSYVKVPKRLTLPQQMAGTLLCLLVYRLLSCVPLPFMNTAMIEILMGAGGSMGLLNVLTGGNLSRMSIAALGVSPYITASIFVQLFGIIIPPVAAMQRDGAVGRKKIKRLTVVLSGIFAVLTAAGMMCGYWQAGLLTVGAWYGAVVPGALMVAASLLVTWMGQLIDDKFFGNGVSLLLLAGIVSTLPGELWLIGKSVWTAYQAVGVAVFAVVLFVLFMFVYFMLRSERVYQVSYMTKISGAPLPKEDSVLSLKLLSSSVMPVIFASSVLAVPAVVQAIVGHEIEWMKIFQTNYWLRPEIPWASAGIPIYLGLIFFFTRYSQSMSMNEIEMADALRKSGCVIEGVAPGLETELFLRKEMAQLNRLGALMLSLVAFLPIVGGQLFYLPSVSVFGTSMILIVSVVMDAWYVFRVEYKSLRYTRCQKKMIEGQQGKNQFVLLDQKVRG